MSCPTASIFLDYGVDQADCEAGDFDISERGMCWMSPWEFAPGTQIRISFSFRDRSGTLRRIAAEGIVVGCEKTAARRYRSALLFMEIPGELRSRLREVRGKPAKV